MSKDWKNGITWILLFVSTETEWSWEVPTKVNDKMLISYAG